MLAAWAAYANVDFPVPVPPNTRTARPSSTTAAPWSRCNP